MRKTISTLLEHIATGLIFFDRDLAIVDALNFSGSTLRNFWNPGIGKSLLRAVPELIGSESVLYEAASGENRGFCLEYVNRKSDNEKLGYFNLSVFAGEIVGSGVLRVTDVTILAVLQQTLEQQRNEMLLYKSREGFRRQFSSDSFLGNSKPIQRVRNTIAKLSKVSQSTVLLLGESGTGKNLVARAIHSSSMPADAPFVDINCAALPENLIEAELFGYEKGAFTHASACRKGLLETAEGGTIFLDEIGDLPLNLQAKLLSVLETKKLRRLGSNTSIQVKARVISATNRDLQKEVAARRFRDDLFFRLNVVTIVMPPLRTLDSDIVLIAEHLLECFNVEFKKRVKGFTTAAKERIREYSWPGNVRELSNCIERAMIFIEREYIDERDLLLYDFHSSYGPLAKEKWQVPPGGIILEDVEKQLIVSALKASGKNKSKAARLLGLSRDTLRYRLEKYQLE